MTSCLEMVTFKLSDGADPEAFAAAAPEITAWAAKQPGFQYRTLVNRGEEGWTDMVWWASEAEARAAAEKMMGEMGGAPFMAMIDPASVTMAHHPVELLTAP